MEATIVALENQTFFYKYGHVNEDLTFHDIYYDTRSTNTLKTVIEAYLCNHYKLNLSDIEAALAHKDGLHDLKNETRISLTRMGMNPVSIACLQHLYYHHATKQA